MGFGNLGNERTLTSVMPLELDRFPQLQSGDSKDFFGLADSAGFQNNAVKKRKTALSRHFSKWTFSRRANHRSDVSRRTIGTIT
jgi:hypothetical protein